VLGAIVCYALTWRATQSEGWADRWASLLVAGNLAWLGAGLSISGLAWLWTLAGKGGVPHGALRTAVLTTLSVAAGWAGSRWSKTELKWLVYPLMAVAAYTLLSRDLGGERTGTLFVSLLFYGSALVVLPKVSSSGRKG
jgi:hypothetical protein